jgi:hypothetical protein
MFGLDLDGVVVDPGLGLDHVGDRVQVGRQVVDVDGRVRWQRW